MPALRSLHLRAPPASWTILSWDAGWSGPGWQDPPALPGLTTLSLPSGISPSIEDALHGILQQAPALERVELSLATCSNLGALRLGLALRTLARLRELQLTHLAGEGAQREAAQNLVLHCRSLQRLELAQPAGRRRGRRREPGDKPAAVAALWRSLVSVSCGAPVDGAGVWAVRSWKHSVHGAGLHMLRRTCHFAC